MKPKTIAILEHDIRNNQQNLAMARQRYGEDAPAVRKLRNSLERLRGDLRLAKYLEQDLIDRELPLLERREKYKADIEALKLELEELKKTHDKAQINRLAIPALLQNIEGDLLFVDYELRDVIPTGY
jgi:chromosome segregation ATPase